VVVGRLEVNAIFCRLGSEREGIQSYRRARHYGDIIGEVPLCASHERPIEYRQLRHRPMPRANDGSPEPTRDVQCGHRVPVPPTYVSAAATRAKGRQAKGGNLTAVGVTGEHPLCAVWRKIDRRAIGDLRRGDGRDALPTDRVALRGTVGEQQVIWRRVGAGEGAGGIGRPRDEVVQPSYENAASADSHLGNVVDEQLAAMLRVHSFQRAKIDASGVLAITDDGKLACPRIEHGEKLRQQLQTCRGVDGIAGEYDEVWPLRCDASSNALLVRADALEVEIADLNDAQQRCSGIDDGAYAMSCDADQVRFDEKGPSRDRRRRHRGSEPAKCAGHASEPLATSHDGRHRRSIIHPLDESVPGEPSALPTLAPLPEKPAAPNLQLADLFTLFEDLQLE
jgi:hypothetical protein